MSMGVPPYPRIQRSKGKAAGLGGGRAKGGVLLPPGVGSPLSQVGLGEKEGGEREEGKGGAAPPS